MEITLSDHSRTRGQIGVETLIVFIAMILVAAIAATILINTAGFLQNQASATSQDSEDQVSNQVLVISSIGEIDREIDGIDLGEFTYDDDGDDEEHELTYEGDVDFTDREVEYDGETASWDNTDPFDLSTEFSSYDTTEVDEVTITWEDADPASDDSVDEITLEAGDTVALVAPSTIGSIDINVMQSPGADEIDLSGASVEYIGPDGQTVLSYGDEASPDEETFSVREATDSGTEPVLTERQDRMVIEIELTQDNDSALRQLEPGEDATVRITTQAGSEAVTILNVPHSLSSYDHGDAVEL